MQLHRIDRIQYIEVTFPGFSCSTQGFTTRHEGVSRPPYNSLNLGMNTQDQQSNVEGNRSLLGRAFGVNHEAIVTPRQVHGSDILVINEPNEDYTHFLTVEGDAIITNQPDVLIGVCVADCAPILICDPDKRVIAAVHAGWKGTASRLVSKTVAGMKTEFGSDPGRLHAAIGPCIQKCCYEVDEPVKKAFQQNGIPWDTSAELKTSGKWQLDLATANEELLLAAGVPKDSIQISGQCVCCHSEQFFSYRRDKDEAGRQMGFIMLNSR
ncbi:MAG: peptidoglycan editing factor PgeF [Desulfuromonadaceae bacterium]|nr:peptidoglycan editing factor PgeF [Desulfuromonadaceae bacterium]MDD2855023.1 peptidoglycan editing factor PgeF [Desulfuromonadaceae bacterium]